jgi:lipopolysaccharide export system protein LptA
MIGTNFKRDPAPRVNNNKSVKRLAILAGTICCLSCQIGGAQTKTPTPTRGSKPSSAAPARASQGSAKQVTGEPESQGKTNDLFGGEDKDRPKGPTDIRCSQEAQFDTKTRSGVFVGNVKVVDPQFTLTTDRLAVRLNKEEDGGGLEEAQADGNVMIVHVNQPKSGQSQAVAGATPAVQAQPQPPQQPITSTGKAERAVYEAKDGSITLTGWPQVTQGVNTHIATAPGVKMILYRDGRMQTYGSTRTLIQDRTATNRPNANGAQ